jgi:hypothetical protein
VLDRVSTFADLPIVEMLKRDFVPVAIDQWYHRRQQDEEGEFWRRIAGQGPRSDINNTTQGLYIAAADGSLLAYNNNRGPERIRTLMLDALARPRPEKMALPADGQPDPRFARRLPEGGRVVQVTSKVLGGYPPPDDQWQEAFQSALGRDNLWILPDEISELISGKFPDSLARRMARFHLTDNTRGEPPMWRADEIRRLEIKFDGEVVSGSVHLETDSGDRRFVSEFFGHIEHAGGQLRRFDAVARGEFRGQGPYTRGAPENGFPLAIAFTLIDARFAKSEFARVPPQGSKGWLPEYLETRLRK